MLPSMKSNPELIGAAAQNHVAWFTENARIAGGEAKCENGVTCIDSPASDPNRSPDKSGEIILAFPNMGINTGEAIDRALALARQKQARQVSCWSVLPTEPTNLAAMLLARGFGWGWQPHWMALDLEQIPSTNGPLPNGLQIAQDDASDWDVSDLPHYDRADAARLQAHARQTPRRTYHFAARLEGKIVGHSLLHLSENGMAGLYNVGVVPRARRRGIGRAISLAACQYARTLGCRYVLLNAATHIYDKLGFVSLGYGQTWWMFAPMLEMPPPPPSLIAFVEALGRGDTSTLAALPPSELPNLDSPLLCKMTPLEVAAKLQQPQAATWLLEAGASPDIIPLYDLGWRDQIPSILARYPHLAGRRLGEHGATPLHEAVSRNDVALAQLLLSTQPSTDILAITDTQFHATPLGWAEHLGRVEIAALLKNYKKTIKRL
jgi:GNAT superfamily N-acetyltransferase